MSSANSEVQPLQTNWRSELILQHLGGTTAASCLQPELSHCREYEITNLGLEDLRHPTRTSFSLFSAVEQHTADQLRVHAGIEAASIVYRGTLFSDLNTPAHEISSRKEFFATTTAHWSHVIGETYDPFKYIYRKTRRAAVSCPALISYDREKLVPAYSDSDESVQWRPAQSETIESSIHSIYYLTGLFLPPLTRYPLSSPSQ
jgi:hypothetical protein